MTNKASLLLPELEIMREIMKDRGSAMTEEPIARLRLLAKEALEVTAEKVCVEPADLAALCAENERLRDIMDRWKHWTVEDFDKSVASLRAENERLVAEQAERIKGYHNDLFAAHAENERLKDCNVVLETRRNDAQREVERLRVELADDCLWKKEAERLREALKTIAKYEECELDSACAKIASAALQSKGE